MANHLSSKKRIRSNDAKRIINRFQHKTMRNAVKSLRGNNNKEEASTALPKVISIIDKLAKKKVIHKNKASNLKSKLTKKVSSL